MVPQGKMSLKHLSLTGEQQTQCGQKYFEVRLSENKKLIYRKKLFLKISQQPQKPLRGPIRFELRYVQISDACHWRPTL